METKSPVSFLAHVARLPQKGMPVVQEANEKERAALAAAHDILGVKKYRVELLLTAWKRHGVKISGKVEADIVQECVLTLEPVENHISEEVEGVFLPEGSKLGRLGFHGGGEIVLDMEGPDSPETFTGDTIDVGAFAEEFFGLGIDPYPRKAGAAVVETDVGSQEADGPLQEKLRLLKLKS